MFGENLILGESFGKIDDKNRIFIPSFTGVEPKEQLLLQTINYNNDLAIKLLSTKEYLYIIERFKKLRENATNIEDFERYTNEIEKICQNLEYLVNVDNQKRIQLPHSIMTKLEWKNKSEVHYKGLGETLLIRKK